MGMQGDPHVRISTPNQPDVCYDVQAAFYDFISLIDDEELGLQVNGAIDHVKKGKDRLAKIGIKYGTTQIAVDDKMIVLIGTHGRAIKTFDYSEEVDFITESGVFI